MMKKYFPTNHSVRRLITWMMVGVMYFQSPTALAPSLERSWGAGALFNFAFWRGPSGGSPWNKTLGGGGTDEAYSVAVDSNGNTYVAGVYRNANTDSLGVKDFADAVLLGASTGGDSEDAFVAKLDSSGVQQWIKYLGGTGNDYAWGVAVDSSANVYVTGTFDNSSSNAKSATDFAGSTLNGKKATASEDAFVVKLNTGGTQQWIRTLGGTGNEFGRSVAVDSSGNVYVTGGFDNDSGNSNGVLNFAGAALAGVVAGDVGGHVFVAKLDSSGTQTWIQKMGGEAPYNFGKTVAVDGSGNVYVGGTYRNDGGSDNTKDFAGAALAGMNVWQDAFVAKLNSSGTQQWIKTVKGYGSDEVMGIALDSSSNVYVVGGFFDDSSNYWETDDFAGNALYGMTATASTEFFVAKLNTSGTQQWIQRMGGTADDVGNASLGGISVDSSSNIYVGLSYNNNMGNTKTVGDFSGSAVLGKSSACCSSDGALVKLDTSGSQLSIQTMGGGQGDQVFAVAVGIDGFIHVAGSFSNNTTDGWTVRDFSNLVMNGRYIFGGQDAFVLRTR